MKTLSIELSSETSFQTALHIIGSMQRIGHKASLNGKTLIVEINDKTSDDEIFKLGCIVGSLEAIELLTI